MTFPILADHMCQTPAIEMGRTETWTCGVYGRMFYPGEFGWVEIQGPRGDEEGD